MGALSTSVSILLDLRALSNATPAFYLKVTWQLTVLRMANGRILRQHVAQWLRLQSQNLVWPLSRQRYHRSQAILYVSMWIRLLMVQLVVSSTFLTILASLSRIHSKNVTLTLFPLLKVHVSMLQLACNVVSTAIQAMAWWASIVSLVWIADGMHLLPRVNLFNVQIKQCLLMDASKDNVCLVEQIKHAIWFATWATCLAGQQVLYARIIVNGTVRGSTYTFSNFINVTLRHLLKKYNLHMFHVLCIIHAVVFWKVLYWNPWTFRSLHSVFCYFSNFVNMYTNYVSTFGYDYSKWSSIGSVWSGSRTSNMHFSV